MFWGSAIYYIHMIYITILIGLWQSKSSTPPSYFFTIQTLDGPHALCPYACKFEIISVISIFLLLVEATEVLFSASSLSFFLRNTITHESLNLAWWKFSWICILTTCKSLLNFKVIGLRLLTDSTSPSSTRNYWHGQYSPAAGRIVSINHQQRYITATVFVSQVKPSGPWQRLQRCIDQVDERLIRSIWHRA